MKRHVPSGDGMHALCSTRDNQLFAADLEDVTCEPCRRRLTKWGCEEEVARVVAMLIRRGGRDRDFAKQILLHTGPWSTDKRTVADRIADAYASASERAEELRRAHLLAQTTINGRARPSSSEPGSGR